MRCEPLQGPTYRIDHNELGAPLIPSKRTDRVAYRRTTIAAAAGCHLEHNSSTAMICPSWHGAICREGEDANEEEAGGEEDDDEEVDGKEAGGEEER